MDSDSEKIADIEDFIERTAKKPRKSKAIDLLQTEYLQLSEQNEQLTIELMKVRNAELIKENRKLLEFQQILIRSNSTELKPTGMIDNSVIKKSLIVEKADVLNHASEEKQAVDGVFIADLIRKKQKPENINGWTVRNENGSLNLYKKIEGKTHYVNWCKEGDLKSIDEAIRITTEKELQIKNGLPTTKKARTKKLPSPDRYSDCKCYADCLSKAAIKNNEIYCHVCQFYDPQQLIVSVAGKDIEW